MKPGIFQIGESKTNLLYVNSRCWVVNGAYEMKRNGSEDSLIYKSGDYQFTATRVSDIDPSWTGDYNAVICAYLKAAGIER